MTDGYNFKNINQKGVYGYWDHMDYIIRTAARKGLYIGMVCIWGSPVSRGEMTVEQAKAYGKFLAERYKDEPNIIWFIGGDIRGDVKTAEWEALATSIKAIDKNHLMTFHPRGRTTSSTWFNAAPWLDFNMFQSGHRRYGQRFGDGDYPIEENTEEDNWRFVERNLSTRKFLTVCTMRMNCAGKITMCAVMPTGRFLPVLLDIPMVIIPSCNSLNRVLAVHTVQRNPGTML